MARIKISTEKKITSKKRLFYFLLISVSLFTIGLFALVAGGEFQVNYYTFGNQYHPDIAIDQKGNFIITWAVSGGEPSDRVFARMFLKWAK